MSRATAEIDSMPPRRFSWARNSAETGMVAPDQLWKTSSPRQICSRASAGSTTSRKIVVGFAGHHVGQVAGRPLGLGAAHPQGLLGGVVDVGHGAVALGHHQEVGAGVEHPGQQVGPAAGGHLGGHVGQRGHEPVVGAVVGEDRGDAQLAPLLLAARAIPGPSSSLAVGVVAADPDGEGLPGLDRGQRPGHDLVDLVAGQQAAPVEPDQVAGVVQDGGHAAPGVDDVAVGVGAQHHERAGLGHVAEQLAHVVELAGQLLGLGHVQAGAGVALERPRRRRRRAGPGGAASGTGRRGA